MDDGAPEARFNIKLLDVEEPTACTISHKKINIIRKCDLLTIGNIQGLANVIVNELIITGLKSKILGYMSNGDNVPEK